MARTANIENEEPRTTEIDMTEAEAEEALKEDMRANEMDYLNGILEAADDVDEETKEIKIIRSGKLLFCFSVHALSDDDMYEIRKKYTKYAKNKRTGMKVTDGMVNAKFRSSLIYNATVAEDQENYGTIKIFRKQLRKKGKKIINALDVIEAALLPGEKEKVLTTLDELCGYNTEEDKVNTAKNL